jgi:bifunctional DNase/RNase
MTYQFAAALLRSSGTGLREVRITRLTDGVFYAQAELSNGAPVLVATGLLGLIPQAPGA